MMRSVKINQKGETLIEALAALAVISIVISAVVTVVTSVISNATFNENQTLATKYAQEGLESVRTIRNLDYAAFRDYNGMYCFGKDQSDLGPPQSSCSEENVETFIRTVTINQNSDCSAGTIRVIVDVAFKDGKCNGETYCHKQTHSSCLSTVNPVQSL